MSLKTDFEKELNMAAQRITDKIICFIGKEILEIKTDPLYPTLSTKQKEFFENEYLPHIKRISVDIIKLIQEELEGEENEK